MCDHPDLENCADRWEDREAELRRQAQHDLDWAPAPTGSAYHGDSESTWQPDWNGLTEEELDELLADEDEHEDDWWDETDLGVGG